MKRNDKYKTDYCAFMSSVIDKEYAEEVPVTELK